MYIKNIMLLNSFPMRLWKVHGHLDGIWVMKIWVCDGLYDLCRRKMILHIFQKARFPLKDLCFTAQIREMKFNWLTTPPSWLVCGYTKNTDHPFQGKRQKSMGGVRALDPGGLVGHKIDTYVRPTAKKMDQVRWKFLMKKGCRSGGNLWKKGAG